MDNYDVNYNIQNMKVRLVTYHIFHRPCPVGTYPFFKMSQGAHKLTVF